MKEKYDLNVKLVFDSLEKNDRNSNIGAEEESAFV